MVNYPVISLSSPKTALPLCLSCMAWGSCLVLSSIEMLSNGTGILSKKIRMLSTEIGVLTTQTGVRVPESLCFGHSPKGPRQFCGGKGLGMGQTEHPNPIHGANFPGRAFVLPPFSVHMATARAQSHFLRAEPRERRRRPFAPLCPCAHSQPGRASLGITAGTWADPALPSDADVPRASMLRSQQHWE